MSGVFYYKEFNDYNLGDIERKKLDEIIKDLEENKLTYQGSIKLISSKGGIKYLRAKLSDEGRLLFTQTKHNNEDIFVMLEVLPRHDYEKSHFLQSTEKTKSVEIKITEEVTEKSPDIVEIKDLERAHWLGKLVTFSATQEDIVKRTEECKFPLIVNGAAGSGKTSVALESLKKIQEKFEGGKILYITKSENLTKESKKLFKCDEATGELETSIPNEIDFLSLHEFLEKQVEDIKGKKPIDRSKFFPWFKKMCEKSEFKKYENEGDKIFEEFTAIIAGKVLLKGYSYGKDEYGKLGKRESIFPENERDSIYDFFKEYRKFIEEDSKYYDPNLIAHECAEEKIYDAVVVDEVQDLTESTLNLILKSLKDESKGNFLLCGDVNQVIHPSFFSLSKLKSFSSNYTADKSLSIYNLQENYRNSQQIIELANRVLHLKNYCFASEDKITADKKEAFFMKSDNKNIGNVSFITESKKQKEISEKVSSSTNWAVLVLDNESKEDARKLFDTPLVFNIHEAKGLEFENVILYKFMSCGAYNGIRNIAKGKDKKIEDTISKIRDSHDGRDINTSRSKDKEDKSFEKFKFYMNALYVGVTRTMDSICIMDKKHDLLEVIKPEEEKILNIEDIKKEESTPEEWKNMALKLIDQGNIEQARDIAETKLLNTKYAKEITKKLETQGYHVGTQDSYKASSELGNNTENTNSQPSQNFETEQNRKEKKFTRSETSTIITKKINAMLSAVLNDDIDKFKEMNISQYGKKESNLELALKNCSLKIAEYLIKGKDFLENSNFDISCLAGEEDLLLLKAAENGHDGVVEFLLQHGANVNARDQVGSTPLHWAVGKGTKKIVDALLEEEEIDVNATNKDGVAPLHLAARRGDKKIVCALLEKEGIDVNVVDIHKLTPLHAAADNAYEEIVDALLEKDGIKINEQDEQGCTPLHCAVYKGSKKIVNALLRRDEIKLNQQSKDGSTPLHVAARGKSKEIVNALLRKDGIKINEREKNGVTPLYVAAHRGNKEIVDALLQQKGIDVNAAHNNGMTPLHVAVLRGYKDVVKLLLEYKADVNAKDLEDSIPLHTAAFKGHKDVVKLLLEYKADVNAKSGDDDRATPLHVVALRGDQSIAQLLLQYGAEVNFNDNKGSTPLHWAAENGHYGVVKLLLECKAEINAKNLEGFTPLHWAAENGHVDVVKLFLKHGAEVNAANDEGNTPLVLVRQGHSGTVNLLLTDPNINVGCIDLKLVTGAEVDKRKIVVKRIQDHGLFENVKEAASEKDIGNLDKILKKIEGLLCSKTEHGFKPSLNYSPDGSDENTTIKTACRSYKKDNKVGGKLLKLLYDYAEKNIGADTEIFKQLKQAMEQEKPQSQLYSSTVSRPSNPGLSM